MPHLGPISSILRVALQQQPLSKAHRESQSTWLHADGTAASVRKVAFCDLPLCCPQCARPHPQRWSTAHGGVQTTSTATEPLAVAVSAQEHAMRKHPSCLMGTSTETGARGSGQYAKSFLLLLSRVGTRMHKYVSLIMQPSMVGNGMPPNVRAVYCFLLQWQHRDSRVLQWVMGQGGHLRCWSR